MRISRKITKTQVFFTIFFLLILLVSVFVSFTSSTLQSAEISLGTDNIKVVAQNLKIPWELVFLPDDSLLLTERPGTLLRIYPNSREQINIAGVAHRGEGGLLGLALHPDFNQNNWLYIYLTSNDGGVLSNRVERYDFDLETNTLSNKEIILDNIPAANNHDGGRIAFGPDNLLYITTGDAGKPSLAQDKDSLAGKILRITDLGEIPADNPFGTAMYSYGHRNPQGLAWDDKGNLWSSEHGPSGVQSGFDEINLIEAGKNYGWPLTKGDEAQEGLVRPVLQSGPAETWAPAALEIVNNKLYFVGLRGAALYSCTTYNNLLGNLKPYFKNTYGRLRIVKASPDKKWLYLATSNTDGRGRPRSGDDKLIAVPISVLE